VQKTSAAATAPHATGPRTDQGKARASTNAVRHGLGGFALVLKGESVAEYRANQTAWFTALAPTTKIEGQLVAQLADIAWRLDRCAKLEHRRHLALVEEKMQETTEWKTCSTVWHATWLTNVIVDSTEFILKAQPFPTAYKSIAGFIAPRRGR